MSWPFLPTRVDLSTTLSRHRYPTLRVVRISPTTPSLVHLPVCLSIVPPESGPPHAQSNYAPKLTRKFPSMRDGENRRPSVHLLIPDSSTLNTKTAPLMIISFRSVLFSRRSTRGITPSRAAYTRRRACMVVPTMPKKGCALG